METFFTVSEQTWLFLWACVLGAALGVVYDMFRVLRIILKHNNIAVFIEDVLFTVFYGLCIFVYITELSRGYIRFFIILGSLLGFTLYILTVGMFVVTIMKKIIKFIKTVFSKIFSVLSKPVKAIYRFIAQKGNVVFVKMSESYKKTRHKSKKSLKHKHSVVYNNHNNTHIIMTGSENHNAGKESKKGKKILNNQTT